MTGSAPSAPKPRVLVPLTIHFAVRYIVRTGLLARLRDCCEPVLALSWDDAALAADLRAEGVEVVRLPDSRIDPAVTALLASEEVAFGVRLRSPSAAIDQRRRYVDRPVQIRLKRSLAWHRARLAARRPGAAERTEAELDAALASGTNLDEHLALLDHERIDAVFSVTPFTVQELVLLHATERAAIPAITALRSVSLSVENEAQSIGNGSIRLPSFRMPFVTARLISSSVQLPSPVSLSEVRLPVVQVPHGLSCMRNPPARRIPGIERRCSSAGVWQTGQASTFTRYSPRATGFAAAAASCSR